MPSPSKTARLPVQRKEETAVCKINILQKDFYKILRYGSKFVTQSKKEPVSKEMKPQLCRGKSSRKKKNFCGLISDTRKMKNSLRNALFRSMIIYHM